MENNLIIKNGKSFELVCSSNVTEVPYNNKFIIDFLDRESLTNYKYIFKENNEKSIDDLYQLDIKINAVGKISFFFLKKSFNKDATINEISTLKDIEITDDKSKANKINKLCEIVSTKDIVFVVYQNDESNSIKIEDLTNVSFNILFIKKKEKKQSNRKDTKLNRYLSLLNKEKLFPIFAFISGLILVFSLSLAVYNCYPNNAIYIFFFICSLAATILNVFIYKDLFKKFTVKNSMFYTSVVANLIGLGAGIGIYIAYYNALKDIPECIPGKETILLISSLTSLGLLILSIITAILFKKIIRKKKQA